MRAFAASQSASMASGVAPRSMSFFSRSKSACSAAQSSAARRLAWSVSGSGHFVRVISAIGAA
jgi:hypothetical protein